MSNQHRAPFHSLSEYHRHRTKCNRHRSPRHLFHSSPNELLFWNISVSERIFMANWVIFSDINNTLQIITCNIGCSYISFCFPYVLINVQHDVHFTLSKKISQLVIQRIWRVFRVISFLARVLIEKKFNIFHKFHHHRLNLSIQLHDPAKPKNLYALTKNRRVQRRLKSPI